MSGGYFDYIFAAQAPGFRHGEVQYIQDRLEDDTIPDLLQLIAGRDYRPEIIKTFDDALETIKKAAIYLKRIDWLVSDDDGEEEYTKKLAEALEGLAKIQGENHD